MLRLAWKLERRWNLKVPVTEESAGEPSGEPTGESEIEGPLAAAQKLNYQMPKEFYWIQ